MSTQKTTTNTNQYDPGSQNVYQGMQSGIGSSLSNLMNASKTYVPLFQQQANQQINQVGNRMNSNLVANQNTNGFSNGSMPGFEQASLARNQRAVGGLQANAFMNSQFQGLGIQQQGTQMAMGYHPLQTGQTNVEQTTGTGTWLTPLLGAAANIGMGFATGGMSTMAQGLGGAFGSIGGQSDPALGSISSVPWQQGGSVGGVSGAPAMPMTPTGYNPYMSNWG